MSTTAPLYPLRFTPIYQYRLWGGRRLENVVGVPLPGEGPFGEAWVLSDRENHVSVVADGPLRGRTIHDLMEAFPIELLGKLASRFRRFPLLLKFLDVEKMLSVQVHPSNADTDLLPAGETGKTEAWVVLEACEQSRIYAGLYAGVTASDLRRAIAAGHLPDQLACFTPRVGDGVFLKAGTVHALGGNVVVFEIQQNSDVTFRLYDWNHVDATTGQPRPLQVDRALACVDFVEGPVHAVAPVVETAAPSKRERLFRCEHFSLWRIHGRSPFVVGAPGIPRILTCIEGGGHVEHEGASHDLTVGGVMLLPAAVGACSFVPSGAATLLEMALPA